MSKILIVDDEQFIRELVRKYANFEGYETEEAENGYIALQKVKVNNSFDLIIMDVMMPELDGFSAVKEIRKYSDVPVIMLSARGEEYDKLYGFELGIDDYVTKPFSPKELMMRVNAILNRYKNKVKENKKVEEPNNTLVYETLVVDLTARLTYIDNKKIDLTLKEFELLACLLSNINVAVTRKQLLEKVWGYDFFGDDRTLDTHMKLLRRKLGSYGKNIVTLRGVGYRFDK